MMLRVAGLLAAAGALWVLPAAASDDGLVRRAGEWDVSVSAGVTDAAPQRYLVCYRQDSSIIDKLKRDTTSCADQHISVDGGTVRVDAVCRMEPDAQVTLHSSVAAAGPDAFHGIVNIHFDHVPAGLAVANKTITADERRVGPCQPGDRPM